MSNNDNREHSEQEVNDTVAKGKEDYVGNKVLMYLRGLPLFEKIFWVTILIFFIAYLILQFMISINSIAITDNNNSDSITQNILRDVEIIVNSDKIKENLENNQTIHELKENLDKNIKIIDRKIDDEINDVFHTVYSNIDTFLDFHYSVKGEYIEMGSKAAGKLEKIIEQKLFGSDFSIRVKDALGSISNEAKNKLSDHLIFMGEKATEKVDLDLNNQIITDLNKQIKENINIQGGKISVLITTKLASKIIQTIAAKIAVKASSKVATKVAIKLGAKSTAASTGAAAGVLCGPLVWICSPVAAATLWFSTDAVIVAADEYYNRDEFKQDIMDFLLEQQYNLKNKLKEDNQGLMSKISEVIQIKYKQTPIKERKKIKIKEKIGI